MATTISKINVQLALASAGLTADVNQANAKLAGIGRGVSSAGGGGNLLGGLFSGAGASLAARIGGIVAAVGAATVSFGALQTAMAKTDAAAKLADNLGTTTEALVSLEHAANLAGKGAQSIDQALGQLTRRIGEAQQGNREQAEAFERLGLSAEQLAAIPVDEAFARIADKINALPTPAAKAAAAVDLFGKSGQDLLGVLALGSDGLAKMAADADALGATFSRQDAAQIEGMNDAITRLQTAFGGLARELAVTVAPVVTALVNAFADMIGVVNRALDVLNGQEEKGNAAASATSAAAAAEGDLAGALDKTGAALDEQKKAFEERQKAAERAAEAMQRRGEQITEALRTPVEKFEDTLAELGSLVEQGAISWETYARGVEKAVGEMEQIERQTAAASVAAAGPIGIARQFSGAAFSAEQSAARAVGQVEAVNRRQLEEQKRHTDLLRRIADAQQRQQPLQINQVGLF